MNQRIDIRTVSLKVGIARVFLSMVVLVAAIVALDFMVYLGATSSSFHTRVAKAFSQGYDYGYSQTFDVAYQKAQKESYQKGYNEAYQIGANTTYGKPANALVKMRNPSYAELMAFLKKDKTDQHPYIPGVYVCFDFAATLNNDADAAGIRCAYVRIRSDQWAHAVVAFQTTDRGLVFIEPQSDKQVELAVGQPYPWWQVGASSPLSYNNKVVEIQVIW